jgi:hypothetical protein
MVREMKMLDADNCHSYLTNLKNYFNMKKNQLSLTGMPVTELNIEEQNETEGGFWPVVVGVFAAAVAVREAYSWGRNLGKERAQGDRGNGGSCPAKP